MDRTEKLKITHKDILLIAENTLFDVEYQPIFSIFSSPLIPPSSLVLLGYEAFPRFSINGFKYSPEEVFSACKDNEELLNMLEVLIKKIHFKKRPDKSVKVFINLSPQSFRSENARSFWINFLLEHQNYVVELIEPYSIKERESTLLFAEKLKANNICFAIDDFFKEGAVFSGKVVRMSKIIKLDMGIIEKVKNSSRFKSFISVFILKNVKKGKTIILEGVESKDDFTLALELGVSHCQGYFFSNSFVYSTAP